jgi:hypothetical protein
LLSDFSDGIFRVSHRQRPVNRGINHGQRLCRELGRGSRHRLRLCRRPNDRAVGTVDGIPNVTVLAPSLTVPSLPSAAPRQGLDYPEGPILPTARPSAKATMTWVLLCQERLSAKLFCAEGPINSPWQRAKCSAKHEFPIVGGGVVIPSFCSLSVPVPRSFFRTEGSPHSHSRNGNHGSLLEDKDCGEEIKKHPF